jgi:hypothetical protein
MEYASYFQYKGSHNPFSFERAAADARASEPSDHSPMDFVSACNPRKRDRAAFESDDSARGLGLTDMSESSKRQRFGNFSVTEVDQVFERVIVWLAANSDRLPRTLVELEQAIQFINSFKARVDPECVFYHLVLNGFLRVTELNNNSSSSDSSSSVHYRFRNSSSSVANISDNDRPFNATTQVDINPYPANFDGSFLIVFPNAGQNSLSGSSRVSRDFVTALNKAVTWLRSSLQLPSTKQGFTTALSKRDLVRISYGGVLEFNTVHHRTNGQHVTVLQAPTFYTAAPIC